MILKRIVLKNFRNYEDQEISFNDKFNFIYGNNGQGKTNILEGITYTTYGKSFLGSAESDCVKFGSTEFLIEGDFLNDLGNTDKIIINYDSTSKSKSIHSNKEKVTVYSTQIFGKFPLVFLTPKSLNITYGNPSDRRKFFDILISQASRLYLDYLKDLAKILKQKNALLRNYSLLKKYSYNEMKDLMFSYNEKLIDISTRVTIKRLSFLSEFKNFFEKNFSLLFNEIYTGYVSYYSDALGEADEDYPKQDSFIRNKIEKLVYEKFDDEVAKAVTLAGPQRDDYIFRLGKEGLENEKFDLKNFASQGEHKTFLLVLKMSEYDYLKDKKSTSPMLLLDDVLSELDEDRVTKIISHLKDFGQIFLTTASTGYLRNLKNFYDTGNISVFNVENAKVISSHAKN